MASPARVPIHPQPLPGTARFAELYSGPLSAAAPAKAPIPIKRFSGPSVSPFAALGGAKAAMAALGIEVVAALLLYGIWHL